MIKRIKVRLNQVIVASEMTSLWSLWLKYFLNMLSLGESHQTVRLRLSLNSSDAQKILLNAHNSLQM